MCDTSRYEVGDNLSMRGSDDALHKKLHVAKLDFQNLGHILTK